ncbi:MAG: hypothetical protein Q9220_002479 [cf. Caloplaca sp. 1 TL-2023]
MTDYHSDTQAPAEFLSPPFLADERSPLLKQQAVDGQQDHDLHSRRTDGSAEDGQVGKRKLIWIMSSLWVANFIVGLDGTVMATLAAPIATSFNSLPLLAWLTTAYLIGQAATQPISGKLTDIFSRQAGLIFSSLLFALGNIICGFAREEWTMILGRVLAGIGGGCLSLIATILTSDLISLRERGIWQGYGNIFWGLGNGLGGVFGGFVNDTWNWRMAFLAQVPITLISLVILCTQLGTIRLHSPLKPLDNRSAVSRVDFLGAFLLVSTLVLFLMGLTTGGNIVPWSHPLPLASLLCAAVLLCTFVYVEQKVAREPILPLNLLRLRSVFCSCLTMWCFNMAMYIFLFYLPLYYRARGISTTRAGAALIPFSVGLPLGSLLAGVIATRTGKYWYLLSAILALMLACASAISALDLETALWLPMVYLGFVGLASGGMLIMTLLALLSSVAASEQAVITSLSCVFRGTGAVIGLAMASAIYQQVLDQQLWSQLGHLPNASEVIHNVRDGLDYVKQLPPPLQKVVRESYMLSLRTTFSSTVGLVFVALVAGLLIKEFELPSTINHGEPVDARDGKDDGQERSE